LDTGYIAQTSLLHYFKFWIIPQNSL